MRLKYKCWDDISIPVYQEIIDIAKDVKAGEDVFCQREIDILAVLCDSDSESLGNIQLEEYAELVREASFLGKIPTYIPPKDITLRGVDYNIVADIAKFTLAQYTEYNALRADASTKMASLLACILVPKTAKHYADGYDVADVVKAIEAELPYYKAFGILHFFLAAQSCSVANTLCLEALKMLTMAMFKRPRAVRVKMRQEGWQLLKASISLGRCWLNR